MNSGLRTIWSEIKYKAIPDRDVTEILMIDLFTKIY